MLGRLRNRKRKTWGVLALPASGVQAMIMKILPRTLILLLIPLFPAPAALHAQAPERVIRFANAQPPPGSATPGPAASANGTVTGAMAVPVTAAGTVLGGLLFAAPFAALTTIAGPGQCAEYVCGPQILGIMSTGAAYLVGAGVGASYAAGLSREPPPRWPVILTSLAAGALGGLIWNVTGETFEPEESAPPDHTAWAIGAGLGFVTHVSLTTLAAHRWAGPRNDSAPQPPPVPPGLRPTPP